MSRTASFLLLHLGLALLLLCGRAAAEEPFAFARTPGKLPKGVLPVEYRVRITPDIESGTFTGGVQATLDFRETVPAIVLNSVGLEITSARLDGDAQALGKPQLDPQEQTLTLPVPVKPRLGKHELSIEFTGTLREQPEGLYVVRYKKDGKEFLLMSNNSRGVMKIPTEGFATAEGIVKPVAAEKAGVNYETITSMKGVEQLDLLDASNTIVLARTDAGVLNLNVVALP